jgi:hypothetical protein
LGAPIVIKIPFDQPLLEKVHAFHRSQVGEFLLPRTLDKFRELAERKELWVATDDQGVAATCYVTRDDNAQDAEFGGIIVRSDLQGSCGLGTAIGTVAIAAYALHDSAEHGLIAHVHIDNTKPLALLKDRLGFSLVEGELAKITKAELEASLGHSIDMRANADGIIYGYTFRFSRTYLDELANRLSTGRLAKVAVTVEHG